MNATQPDRFVQAALDGGLSPEQIERLKNWKQRYQLESRGFSTAEAARLVFARWLYRHNLIGG